MTAVQSFSSVSPSIPLQRSLSVLRPAVRRETGVLPLDQQGVRTEWFTRGIEESNCALFHASLYPILPQLTDRIQSWLRSNNADSSMACDQSSLASFALDVIVLAFEKRHQWRQDQAVLHWLTSFIPVACAEWDPT